MLKTITTFILAVVLLLAFQLLRDSQPNNSKLVGNLSNKQPHLAALVIKEAVAEKAPDPPPEPETPQLAPVDENDAKMFIYYHESGNRTTAVNAGGCRGLGQACPGSKLPCGDDYACQDAYFTQYMQGRYNTWENAKAFWLAHNWW